MKDILKLYLIADYLYYDENFYEKVKEAIKGGVTAVQFRFKGVDDGLAYEIAKNLKEICKEKGVAFFINNRPDFAILLDADGVHIGQDDLPLTEVKRIVCGKIVGISVGNKEEFEKVMNMPFDYLSFGSVFATPTKPDAGKPIGLENLKKLVEITPDVPKIAIGGISEENALSVIQTGVCGIAVSSAIMKSTNPYESARRLREIVEKGLKG
ncbi:MAG: thiamine phosphate synthase [bacterium]|nr:thiamine phosphate synthase [bacterium]